MGSVIICAAEGRSLGWDLNRPFLGVCVQSVFSSYPGVTSLCRVRWVSWETARLWRSGRGIAHSPAALCTSVYFIFFVFILLRLQWAWLQISVSHNVWEIFGHFLKHIFSLIPLLYIYWTFRGGPTIPQDSFNLKFIFLFRRLGNFYVSVFRFTDFSHL